MVLLLGGIAAVGIERAGLLDRDAPRPAELATFEEASRRFHRGVAKLEVGLLADAVEELAGAARLAPAEPAVWADLGLAHAGLGAFDEAAKAIGRAVELAPENGDILYLDARVASLDGRPEAAIATLRRAVEVDPSHLKARFALARELEDSGGPAEVDEADRQLERLAEREPDNPAVLVDRARLAAKRGDAPGVVAGLARLERFASSWPQPAAEQLRAAVEAAASGDSSGSARAIAFLRNLLLLEPPYRDGLARVAPPDPLVGDPFSRFLRHDAPPSGPAPGDEALTFRIEPFGATAVPPGNLLLVASLDGVAPPGVFAGGAGALRRVDASGPGLAWKESDTMLAGTALDWNGDFRTDFFLAGAAGARLLVQSAEGSFVDRTPAPAAHGGPPAREVTGVWAADVEMDGDLDLVVGARGVPATVLRNNGDGTWLPIRPFGEATALGAFVWVDLDDDGDPDAAALDGAGALRLFANLRAGRFVEVPAPAGGEELLDLAAGDVDGDGTIDLVALGRGVVRRWSRVDSRWSASLLAEWSENDPDAPAVGATTLIVADLDNNGALDFVVSGSGRGTVWLGGADRTFRRLAAPLAFDARTALDLDGDGRLELVGFEAGRAVRATGRGARSYHFHVVRPRAQSTAGDQRINSFGIGGVVEARSGGWVQRQAIVGSTVHFGLGDRTAVDVTRIVWPNGVPQADFDSAVDGTLVAEQRLKGSCPWVFADDGGGMRFVTDFLWRSPLGLRINAQDTAGVTQTEDWVKIRGDQLVARDGVYDIRITAELWETHFVDRAALLVVDRPSDVEVFVDERFVPVAPPALALHATRPPRPFLGARDERGNDVTALVARRDGRHLATFALGRYQGVADDHYVELELEREIPAAGPPLWLVGHGWIYPTDSSLNVAIGQGGAVVPSSLALEAQDAEGRWVVVAEGLGFPAGKNKTVLLDLGAVARAGVAGARRIRLRTNLEIYWDQLALAVGAPEAPLRTMRLEPERADLRSRGYSATTYDRRERPEVPEYARLAGVAPRWRDLAGFYTRFGDVRELLVETEDRYVIMNAGDELRLSFRAPSPPPPGWARDYVLVGDGWVKDGDFNTTASKTVQPLPEHGRTDYASPSTTPTLEEDPVWRRHVDDWIRFHTRFVAPRGALDAFELAREEAPR